MNLDNTDQKYNFLKQIQGLAEQKCRITSAYVCYEPVIHTLYRPKLGVGTYTFAMSTYYTINCMTYVYLHTPCFTFT